MKPVYRRRYVVDSGYQFAQAAVVVVANALVALLMAGLLSWFYLLEWDGSIVVDHNRRVPVYVLTLLLIVTLGTTLLSLRRSRMIAGVLRKLHRILSDAGEGVLPDREITFRRSDYFSQLADPLNRCLERLRRQGDGDAGAILAGLREIATRAEGRRSADAELLGDLRTLILRFERHASGVEDPSSVR